jgi:recombination protein RecA
LCLVAEAQRHGLKCVYVDAEHALHRPFAKSLGVDTDKLTLISPIYGEQVFDALDSLIRSKKIDLIVVDSVAALIPKSQLEGEYGQATMGAHARLMSSAIPKLVGIIDRAEVSVVFINQVRDTMAMYGTPSTTTGGKALKFYASVRLEVKAKGPLLKSPSSKFVLGNRFLVKVIKNRLGEPFGEVNFKIINGEGVFYDDDPMGKKNKE